MTSCARVISGAAPDEKNKNGHVFRSCRRCSDAPPRDGAVELRFPLRRSEPPPPPPPPSVLLLPDLEGLGLTPPMPPDPPPPAECNETPDSDAAVSVRADLEVRRAGLPAANSPAAPAAATAAAAPAPFAFVDVCLPDCADRLSFRGVFRAGLVPARPAVVDLPSSPP